MISSFWGIVLYKGNIILLGLTTKKNATHVSLAGAQFFFEEVDLTLGSVKPDPVAACCKQKPASSNCPCHSPIIYSNIPLRVHVPNIKVRRIREIVIIVQVLGLCDYWVLGPSGLAGYQPTTSSPNQYVRGFQGC